MQQCLHRAGNRAGLWPPALAPPGWRQPWRCLVPAGLLLPICWVASEQIFQSPGSAVRQEQPHSSPCIGHSSAQSRGYKACTESTGVKEIHKTTEPLAFYRKIAAHNLHPHLRSALWPGHSLLCSPIPCTTDPSSHGFYSMIQRSDGSEGQLHPEKPAEQTVRAHYHWDNNTHQHTNNVPAGR